MLELHNISNRFDETLVLQDVSLQIGDGEIVVLLGPSGSGKTTLLRIIAGLEEPEAGEVRWNGRRLQGIPPHQRGFGLVFQDYALFPHKNVYQNVAFGLRMLGWEQPRIEARVRQVLTLVGLADFEARNVYDLSGGEQQRVALARSLAPAPRLLLLDEPLGALDRALRERLMGELRQILKEAGQVMGNERMTAVYVTHDQAEAFAVADRIVIMRAGQIVQQDKPINLYRHPATPFVARFLGMENLLSGEMVRAAPPIVGTALGELHLAEARADEGQPVTVLVRPDAAQFVTAGEEAQNHLSGTVAALSFRGRYQLATITVPAAGTVAEPVVAEPVALQFEFDAGERLPEPGSPLDFCLVPERLVLLDSD